MSRFYVDRCSCVCSIAKMSILAIVGRDVSPQAVVLLVQATRSARGWVCCAHRCLVARFRVLHDVKPPNDRRQSHGWCLVAHAVWLVALLV